MKNIVTAAVLTLLLAAISFGQSGASKPRIAVLEFTADNSVPARDRVMVNLKQISVGVVEETKGEAKQIIYIITPSSHEAVREYYRTYLGRQVDPAGAAKIGRLLGVEYVMTGHAKVIGGKLSLQTQIVKVSTGDNVWVGPVILAGDWNADGSVSSADYNQTRNGNLQITQFVVKPAIQMLVASLKSADL